MRKTSVYFFPINPSIKSISYTKGGIDQNGVQNGNGCNHFWILNFLDLKSNDPVCVTVYNLLQRGSSAILIVTLPAFHEIIGFGGYYGTLNTRI